MAGIRAAVQKELKASGKLAACYREHARLADGTPAAGTLRLRFLLGTDGRAGRFDVLLDTLGRPGLTRCMQEALAAVQFPPPGDVPCEVVYPFTFQVGK
jgi:hypothetical protein